MKACSHCGQQIQDAAIKCRYCGQWLTATLPAPETSRSPQPVIQRSAASGMAIASFVLGLLWMYWIGSILALCFGYLARREIRRDPGRMQGDGMAAGIILGWIGVGTLALTITWLVSLHKIPHQQPNARQKRITASLIVDPLEFCGKTDLRIRAR